MATNTNTEPEAAGIEWTLGDRLGKALRIGGVSHGEMAELLDVNRNTIGNYIADRTTPKRSYMTRWAMRCGVPVEWIETGEFDLRDPEGPGGQGIGQSAWNVVSLTARAAGTSDWQAGPVPAEAA